MSKHEQRKQESEEMKQYAKKASKTFSNRRPVINMDIRGSKFPPLVKFSGEIHIPLKNKQEPYISSFEMEA